MRTGGNNMAVDWARVHRAKHDLTLAANLWADWRMQAKEKQDKWVHLGTCANLRQLDDEMRARLQSVRNERSRREDGVAKERLDDFKKKLKEKVDSGAKGKVQQKSAYQWLTEKYSQGHLPPDDARRAQVGWLNFKDLCTHEVELIDELYLIARLRDAEGGRKSAYTEAQSAFKKILKEERAKVETAIKKWNDRVIENQYQGDRFRHARELGTKAKRGKLVEALRRDRASQLSKLDKENRRLVKVATGKLEAAHKADMAYWNRSRSGKPAEGERNAKHAADQAVKNAMVRPDHADALAAIEDVDGQIRTVSQGRLDLEGDLFTLDEAEMYTSGTWEFVKDVGNWFKRLNALGISVTTAHRLSNVLRGKSWKEHVNLTGERSVKVEFAPQGGAGTGGADVSFSLGIVLELRLNVSDDRRLRAVASIRLAPALNASVGLTRPLFELGASLGITIFEQTYTFVDEKHFAYYMAFRIAHVYRLGANFSRYRKTRDKLQLYHALFGIYSQELEETIGAMLQASGGSMDEFKHYMTKVPVVKVTSTGVSADLGFSEPVSHVGISVSAGFKVKAFQRQRLDFPTEQDTTPKPLADRYWTFLPIKKALNPVHSFLNAAHALHKRKNRNATMLDTFDGAGFDCDVCKALKSAGGTYAFESETVKIPRHQKRPAVEITYVAKGNPVRQAEILERPGNEDKPSTHVAEMDRGALYGKWHNDKHLILCPFHCAGRRLAHRELETSGPSGRIRIATDGPEVHEQTFGANYKAKGLTINPKRNPLEQYLWGCKNIAGTKADALLRLLAQSLSAKLRVGFVVFPQNAGDPVDGVAAQSVEAEWWLHRLDDDRYGVILADTGGGAPFAQEFAADRRVRHAAGALVDLTDADLHELRDAQARHEHAMAPRMVVDTRLGWQFSTTIPDVSFADAGLAISLTYIEGDGNRDNDGFYLNLKQYGFPFVLSRSFESPPLLDEEDPSELPEHLEAVSKKIGKTKDLLTSAFSDSFKSWKDSGDTAAQDAAANAGANMQSALEADEAALAEVTEAAKKAAEKTLKLLGVTLERKSYRFRESNYVLRSDERKLTPDEDEKQTRRVLGIYRQYTRYSYATGVSAGIDFKVSGPGGAAGVKAAVGTSKTIGMHERLGDTTVTYFQTVFNGLKKRINGRAQWDAFLARHERALRNVFKRLGGSKVKFDAGWWAEPAPPSGAGAAPAAVPPPVIAVTNAMDEWNAIHTHLADRTWIANILKDDEGKYGTAKFLNVEDRRFWSEASDHSFTWVCAQNAAALRNNRLHDPDDGRVLRHWYGRRKSTKNRNPADWDNYTKCMKELTSLFTTSLFLAEAVQDARASGWHRKWVYALRGQNRIRFPLGYDRKIDARHAVPSGSHYRVRKVPELLGCRSKRRAADRSLSLFRDLAEVYGITEGKTARDLYRLGFEIELSIGLDQITSGLVPHERTVLVLATQPSGNDALKHAILSLADKAKDKGRDYQEALIRLTEINRGLYVALESLVTPGALKDHDYRTKIGSAYDKWARDGGGIEAILAGISVNSLLRWKEWNE